MADKTWMTIEIDVETGEISDAYKKNDRNDKARRAGSTQELKEMGIDLGNATDHIPTAVFLTKSSPGCVTYYHRGQYYVV